MPAKQHVTQHDLAQHLVGSAQTLRARDEALQAAIRRVRAGEHVATAEWIALAEAVEASLRVPSSTLLMLCSYVEGIQVVEPTTTKKPSLMRRVFSAAVQAALRLD